MRPNPALALLLAAALSLTAAGEPAPRRLGFLAELSAGPLLGIDRPLKGCSGGLLLGASLAPFEGGLRAGAAYDAGLSLGLLRLDLELGLGNGLRAIVGGLLPLGELGIPDPSGAPGALVPVTEGPWPDRFGLAARLAELPWRALGASLAIDAELVYTDFRLARGASSGTGAGPLAGMSAFAAGVEACVSLRLRWDGCGSP